MLLLTSDNVQVAAIESLRMPPPAVAQMLVETKIQKAVLAEATRKAADAAPPQLSWVRENESAFHGRDGVGALPGRGQGPARAAKAHASDGARRQSWRRRGVVKKGQAAHVAERRGPRI